MSSLFGDIRFSLRMLAKSPVITLAAVLTLTIGIGSNTALFSVLYGVLFRPLPYSQPDRIMHVGWQSAAGNGHTELDGEQVKFLLKQPQVYEAAGAVTGTVDTGVTVAGPDSVQQRDVVTVTKDYFRVFDASPEAGRTFSEEESQIGGPDVVVISDALSRSTFASPQASLGQTLRINGRPHQVIGVMPPQFSTRTAENNYRPNDVWTSLRLDPRDGSYAGDNFEFVLRLRSGETQAKTQSELQALSLAYREHHPHPLENSRSEKEEKQYFYLLPYAKFLVGDVRRDLWMLESAVALLLLIACANVAALLLARGTARSREISIRLALGATTGRVVRLLLLEGILLSLASAALGILLAFYTVPLLVAVSPTQLPRLESVRIDSVVALFAVALSVLTAILFSIVPAVRAARGAHIDGFRPGALAPTTTTANSRTLRTLVAGQMAIALVLLAGAGLLLESLSNVARVAPGFRPDRLVVAQIPLTLERYATTPETERFANAALQSIRSIPGVHSAAFGPPPLTRVLNLPMAPASDRTKRVTVRYLTVDPAFVSTLAVPIVSGHMFTESEAGSPAPVVVINEALARKLFPKGDAVGQYLAAKVPILIVGVISDVHNQALDSAPDPQVLVPLHQAPDSITEYNNQLFLASFLIRTSEEVNVTSQVTSAIQSADPGLPRPTIRSIQAFFDKSLVTPRFYSGLMGTFAALALLLTAVGLYGTISYDVAQRTREIGIRMALGARQFEVARMFLRSAFTVLIAGASAGLIGAFIFTSFIRSWLFDIPKTNISAFVAALALLAVAAVLAAYLPARRATRVDPMVALRYE